jgi:hypothetical protein
VRATCSILEFKINAGAIIIARRKNAKAVWETEMSMPLYIVRHLGGDFEELSCFRQLEDESAAMYFNIIHGGKVRRRFTTERAGDRCADYVLVAKEAGTDGCSEEREIALFNAP